MKRRALSTIVGAAFFVIVMGSTISYVGYSMDLIGDLAESVDVKQEQNLNRQNEEFMITDVSINNNEFNLTVTNTGGIPINITKMWAQNMTDSTWNQTKYQLNQLVYPGQSVSDVGAGTGLVALNSSSYNVKLVTERGTALDTQILSPSGQSLEMTLYSTPENPLTNNNVNLLFSVKNNLTDGSIIQSLTPIMDVTETGTATATIQGTVTPASVEALGPGEIAFFEWDYLIQGNNTDVITFNATIANAIQGNYVTDSSTIMNAPAALESVRTAAATTVGDISMNYTSWEACEPSTQDCYSDDDDWFSAWEVVKDKEYLWRVEISNEGEYDVILDKWTTMISLPGNVGGGQGSQLSYFIRAPSTTTVENPGPYDSNNPTILNTTSSSTAYFGTKLLDNSDIQKTNSAAASVGLSIVIYGYQDENGNGTIQPSDPPYSQTIPFQAYNVLP